MKTKKQKSFGSSVAFGDINFPKHLTPKIIHSALFIYNAKNDQCPITKTILFATFIHVKATDNEGKINRTLRQWTDKSQCMMHNNYVFTLCCKSQCIFILHITLQQRICFRHCWRTLSYFISCNLARLYTLDYC